VSTLFLATVFAGKVSMQKSAVYNAFPGVHAELYVTERSDLDPAVIASKLQKLMGSGVVTLTP
jgi:hypothetical protein